MANSTKQQIKKTIQKIQGKEFIHFLHIGKTGGTAIKHVLRDYQTHYNFIIYLHKHNFILRDIPKNEKFIFFVRDPVDRFISGFYSRLRQGQPKYFSPWSDGESRAFFHFKTPNELALALYSNHANIKVKAQNAMTNIQHIRDSFWNWFEDSEKFLNRAPDVFFWGSQENLNQDFELLKEKLNLPKDIGLPKENINAHKNPTDLDKFLESKAISNLKSWYKKDYEFIDICKKYL